MKKYFFFALTAAMMSFAGCQEKELEAPVNPNQGGSTFELVADIAQTKTTLDATDYSVEWETGDIVYLVTSDGTWGAPYVDKDNTNLETIAEFVYADGRFTSDAAITAGEYTFKAMYAHESQKSYHRGQSSTHKLQSTQTQDCANPTAHIKGNDALVGMFTAYVPATDKQAVTMSHLYTLMQVNVRNSTGASVDVTKFEMTAAGADLAAVFNVDFENTAVTTKSGASSTITVNVTGGNVDAGQALPVYFVMAPLSDYTGDVTFKVTAADGKTYTKTIAVSKLDFSAGAYNTTPYTISEADVVEPEQTNVTWNLATTSYSSADANMVEWTSEFVTLSLEKSTSSTAANNYLGGVTTDNGTNAHTRVYKGQIMTFVPVGKNQIEKIEFVSTSSDYADNLSNSVWTNADVTSSKAIVTATPNDGHSEVSVTIGSATRFTSIIVYYSYDEDYVPTAPVPVITADASVSVAAAGGVAELSYSVKNPVEGKTVSASTTVDWISDFNYTTAGKVSFSVAENTGEARNGKVTLSYEGADSKEVTVTQAAGVTVAPTKVTVKEFTQLTGNEQTVYELSGVVSEIYQAYSEQYGNISFYIQDETGKVLIFRMTCDEEIGNAMRVGDEVTVQGRPTIYNEAIQMAQGCVCVAYTPAPYLELLSESASVAYDVITYSVTVNSNVEWTASASNGVTLDKTSGNGNATVSMTFVANDTQVDKTHTVTFIAGDKSKTFTLTQKTKPAPGDPTEFTDVLTRETTGVTGTSYKAWTYTSATTCAAYAGNSAGGNESIQLRSKDNAGIVTTTSGGYLKKVLVAWNDNTAEGRTLVVYGKNAAYSATSDLYDDSTSGTKLGEIVNGTTELVINGDYQYIGIRSKDGALYLTNISITWSTEPGSGGNPEPSRSPRNLAFSSSTATATVGQPFTPPTLNGEKSGVTYTSSNANVATIDSSTGIVTLVGEGSTTITASAPKTEQYEAGTANYTLTVSAAQQGGGEPEKGAPYSYEISNSSSKSNSWNKLMGGTNNSAINISAVSNKSITMGDLNWTVSASGASQIYFSGQQIGSSSNYISSFVLESDSYNGAVESITLTTCSNAGTTTIEVYVGGEQLGSTETLPNSGTASDVTFRGDSLLEGKIYIKYTIPTAKKNIKITKISIN